MPGTKGVLTKTIDIFLYNFDSFKYFIVIFNGGLGLGEGTISQHSIEKS